MVKVFTNYKENLASFDVVNRRELGFKNPGRVRGFDTFAGSALDITIDHNLTGINQVPKIPTDPPLLTGVLYTRQGCIIQSDEILYLTGLGNASNGSPLIEKVICLHTYVDSPGGTDPEFRLEDESYTLLANEIVVGRIITPANTANYNSSVYYPEYYTLDYQHKLTKIIKKAQTSKAVNVSSQLIITPNDPEIIIITSSADLSYISNLRDNAEIKMIYQGTTGFFIKDYSNVGDAAFGFTDIATPSGEDVILVNNATYVFTWVTLSSFTGWMLTYDGSGSGKVKIDATDTTPGYLNDKLILANNSGLLKNIIGSGNKTLELDINRVYDSNNVIIDLEAPNIALSELDSALWDIMKGLLFRDLPFKFETGFLVKITGCIVTGTDPGPRTITKGYVYYNGNFYFVPAANFNTPGGQIARWVLGTKTLGLPIMNFSPGIAGTGLFDENSASVINYTKPRGVSKYLAWTDNIEISGGSSIVKFTNTMYDPFSEYNNGTGEFKPLVPGYYLIQGSICLKKSSGTDPDTDDLNFQLRINTTDLYNFGSVSGEPNLSDDMTTVIMHGQFIIYFNGTTDYARTYLSQGDSLMVWKVEGQFTATYLGKENK